jgi:hypothetical protein
MGIRFPNMLPSEEAELEAESDSDDQSIKSEPAG